MPPPPAQASGRAVAALVLGILSIVACWFFTGIPAAILGKMELNDIEKGIAPAAGKGFATAGFWMGIIVSGCSCLGMIGYIITAISVASSVPTYPTYGP
jgi:hypothetical protein